MTKDDLEDILGTKEEFRCKDLASSLKEFIGIEKETGNFIPKNDFYNLSNYDKIVVMLMGNIVREKLDMSSNRKMSYEELSSEIGIQKGTVKAYEKKYDFIEEKDKVCYIPEDKISEASVLC